MAYSQEKWDKAKGFFEAGLTLSQIKEKTGIDRSAISRKAKKQQWQQGKNSDYIEAKEIIATKKATESNTSIVCADEVADDNIRRKNLIYGLTEKILNNIDNTISETVTIEDEEGNEIEKPISLDSKSAKEYIEAIDKASVTLGVNQRHANSQVNIQNTNAQQTNIKTLDDFYEEL